MRRKDATINSHIETIMAQVRPGVQLPPEKARAEVELAMIRGTCNERLPLQDRLILYHLVLVDDLSGLPIERSLTRLGKAMAVNVGPLEAGLLALEARGLLRFERVGGRRCRITLDAASIAGEGTCRTLQ